ncbi:MAG: hypothetical protein AAFR42_00040 [Cyanobacteria bacterium J06628_6]
MDIDMQRLANAEPSVFGQFDDWITEQIRRLSVEAIASGMFTCTACGEVEGDYILTYRGDTFRFDTLTTYAFLQFVLEKAVDGRPTASKRVVS